ncbi:hypothetical protein P154DRAFT_571197 [Amniculicola lignicola CBS 123094]|uniref:LPXTG-domain-containing protein n=1 Tax=Amniculicola lignicola CBS 123094 TaxID=1392246 RepID=A0A6A5WUG4_9PLEO|nr:hypothetical protein P154DRAFT_571197 [Amniculicola lignicola CBS 123094]
MLFPRLSILSVAFCLLHLGSLSLALEVTPNSPCANFCINDSENDISDPTSSETLSRDLSCLDSDFQGENSTAVGRKFKSCIGCQVTSEAVDEESDENDVFWFLYNLKATVAWCVTGFFEKTQNPNITQANMLCGSQCDTISTALNDKLKDTNLTLTYNFCEADDENFMMGVDQCRQCLGQQDNTQLLANFLAGLKSACEQFPDPMANPGETVYIVTDLFSIAPRTIATTATEIDASLVLETAIGASSTGLQPSSTSSSSSSISISGGVIAGIIAGGVSILVIIIGLAVCLLRMRKKVKDSQTAAKEMAEEGAKDRFADARMGAVEMWAPDTVAEMYTQVDPVEKEAGMGRWSQSRGSSDGLDHREKGSGLEEGVKGEETRSTL